MTQRHIDKHITEVHKVEHAHVRTHIHTFLSMVSVLLSTSSLTECLLSSWALEWQEWAPQKPPERAEDL